MRAGRRGLAALVLALLFLTGCGAAQQELPEPTPETPAAEEQSLPEASPAAEEIIVPEPADDTEEREETDEMKLTIGDTAVAVHWEENESVEALKEMVEQEPLTIELSMYGGFEQVGSIGQRLPRNDVQTTTGAGDIVLYAGNQIVLFYGSNSWAYTRLGHITDKTAAQMAELLGHGDVTITIGRN